jgi:fructose-1,6-bisphosphatase/inositol monophosphatase family enzyme
MAWLARDETFPHAKYIFEVEVTDNSIGVVFIVPRSKKKFKQNIPSTPSRSRLSTVYIICNDLMARCISFVLAELVCAIRRYNLKSPVKMEVVVGSQYGRELDLVVKLIRESGTLASRLFYGDGFKVHSKADGSKVTNIDFAVSSLVVKAAQKRGIGVRSEEEGSTARYGENRVLDLDPIDSTNDLVEGHQRRPRRSNAAPSLGFWDEKPVAGAVVFPLLGVSPIMYLASKGGGAYREQGGRRVRLKIDARPTRGIVFVSSKAHMPAAQAVSRTLSEMGYTPVPEHGAVFKACGVADRDLLRQYHYNGVYSSGIPVVGFLARKVYLHDVAAVTCIVREAGGFATSPRNQEGKQPWVAANNRAVYNDLVRLATVE